MGDTLYLRICELINFTEIAGAQAYRRQDFREYQRAKIKLKLLKQELASVLRCAYV